MIIRLKKNRVLMHMICISMLLEAFLPAPFTFSSFKFEWPYFISCLLLIAVFIHKRESKFASVKNSLFMFWCWCFILLMLAIVRFQSSLLFTGVAHIGRMVLMFSVYIWILSTVDSIDRMYLYKIFRLYAVIFCLIIFYQGITSGGTANTLAFTTNGTNKNSLGYSVVCCAAFFCAYEKNGNLEKRIPFYIWWPMCFCICLFTKSGTAVVFILIIAAIAFYESSYLKTATKITLSILVLTVAIMFINIDFLIDFFDSLSINKLSEFLYSFRYSNGTTLGSTTDLRLSTQLEVLQEFNLDMALGRFYYYYFAIHGYTAHSLYLQILYDTGILGLFLFIRFCYRNVKYSENKLEILVLLAYSLIEVFLIQYTSLIVLAILVTMPMKKSDPLTNMELISNDYK